MTAIIFDLWETLGTKNVGVSSTLRERFGTPKEDYLLRYERAVQLRAWESEEDMAQSYLAEFGIERTSENTAFVTDVFRQGIDRATMFPGMRELLGELHAKYRIGILSNTTIFESAIPQRWGVPVDAACYSWQTGVLKPAPESFAAICELLGVRPQDCVFVDDSERNVAAARAYGMEAIRFEGVDGLRAELHSHGLL